jgi:hypothetical protein
VCGFQPFSIERPEVKDIGDPDKHDKKPTTPHITDIWRIHTHYASWVLKNPPCTVEKNQYECKVGQSRPGTFPSFDELPLLKK